MPKQNIDLQCHTTASDGNLTPTELVKFQKLGFKISYKEVKSLAKGEIGRPHIAKVILKNNPRKVNSIEDVFEKYLGSGKKAYVERKNKIDIKQAIKVIHAANGLAFISHPGAYNNFDINKFIKYFTKNCGDGIETYYAYESSNGKLNIKNSNKINKKFQKIAKKYNLLESGGSDFHGKSGQVLGKLKISYSVLERLKERLIYI